jgi:hypothetical protein
VGVGGRLAPLGEERLVQLLLGGVDLVQGILVQGQLTHQSQDDGHVAGGGGADAREG